MLVRALEPTAYACRCPVHKAPRRFPPRRYVKQRVFHAGTPPCEKNLQFEDSICAGSGSEGTTCDVSLGPHACIELGERGEEGEDACWRPGFALSSRFQCAWRVGGPGGWLLPLLPATPRPPNCSNAAQGDSGGPLVDASSDSHVLEGLLSFGDEKCKTVEAYYTSVRQHLQWIRTTLDRKKGRVRCGRGLRGPAGC